MLHSLRTRKPLLWRFLSGGFWALAGNVPLRAASMLTALIVARWLGGKEFGIYFLLQATLAMLAAFALAGMGQTTARNIALYRDEAPERAVRIALLSLAISLLTGIVSMTLLYAGADHIARDLFAQPELADPTRLVSPAILLMALNSTLSGILLGLEAFRQMARINMALSLASILFTVAGLLARGLEGVIIALILTELFNLTACLYTLRKTIIARGINLRTRPDWRDISLIWRFSLPLWATSLLHAPVMWAGQAIITRQSNGLIEIAYFSAGQKWMTLVVTIPMTVSSTYIPIISNLLMEDRRKVMPTALRLGATQFLMTALPALAVALLSSHAALVFGADFSEARPVIVVMMILAPVFALRHLTWQILVSTGRTIGVLWVQVIWAATMLALAWAWRTQGGLGLAKAMLGAYGLSLLAGMVLIMRMWRNAPHDKIDAPPPVA